MAAFSGILLRAASRPGSTYKLSLFQTLETTEMPTKTLEERAAEMRARMAHQKGAMKTERNRREQTGAEAVHTPGRDAPVATTNDPLREPLLITNSNGTVTITRENLYALVWREPMTQAAARFGISSNYLL